jgi:hypothetical protein
VVLHKLHSLAAIYHLNPLHITSWYEAPFEETFRDAASLPSPPTHLSEPQIFSGQSSDPAGRTSEPDQTKLLSELPAQLGSEFLAMKRFAKGRYRYGHIGLSGRRMGRFCVQEAWCWSTHHAARWKTRTGIMNMIGRCTLWSFGKDIVAVGSRRTDRD